MSVWLIADAALVLRRIAGWRLRCACIYAFCSQNKSRRACVYLRACVRACLQNCAFTFCQSDVHKAHGARDSAQAAERQHIIPEMSFTRFSSLNFIHGSTRASCETLFVPLPGVVPAAAAPCWFTMVKQVDSEFLLHDVELRFPLVETCSKGNNSIFKSYHM